MTASEPLRALARRAGVQSSYRDALGRTRRASDASLIAAVRALGFDIRRPEDAAAACEDLVRQGWKRLCEPVVVARRGTVDLPVRVPAHASEGTLEVIVRTEQGDERSTSIALAPIGASDKADVDGGARVAKTVRLPFRVEDGYHSLTLRTAGLEHRTLVIAAPLRAPEGPDRAWGTFLPLHALRSGTDWGTGDLGDLGRLGEWVRGLGGTIVATLPMLAAFLDEPCEPSPYSPASRLFFNELYLDPAGAPEFDATERVRSALAAAHPEIRRLRGLEEVDHAAAMRVKRGVLEPMAEALWGSSSRRLSDLRSWIAAHPTVKDYAHFRSECERRRTPWRTWPAAQRGGALVQGAQDPSARYHMYVQWLADQQLSDLAGRDGGLYLDLPLGVHPDGYDVWRYGSSFALDASGGAPPDAFFSAGQDWGFAPLHPQRIRDDHYRYPIACIRLLADRSAVMRIDHVMGLHRLFWIPRGMEPSEGVYVRYRPEEWWAIVCLEASRAGTMVVGEDLGTVPATVRRAMHTHGIKRTYVVPFETSADPARAIAPPPRESLAALNTHDMAPFAAFWTGADIDERERSGAVGPDQARSERAGREPVLGAMAAFLRERGELGTDPSTADVTAAAYAFLASSEARAVIVNLEDLWGELRPQNTPGTATGNWRRRAAKTLEELTRAPEIEAVLRTVQDRRRASANDTTGRNRP